MNILSMTEVYILLAIFGFTMICLVWFKSKTETHAQSFLVADRNVGPWQGAFSIAVSWIWAPAIFICAMQAYTKGLPGIFWFTVPNVLCFFVFALIAKRIREEMPDGYTLPEYIWQRFGGNKKVHIAFLIIALGYQLGAIIINAVAGGSLLHLVSGIAIEHAILGMVAIALAYSLLAGLKASIFTDIIQMVMILSFAFILVPWAIINSGGFENVVTGLSGISGEYGNIFDSWIAYTLGIPMAISLISGPISDQMFYQRTMAVKKENVVQVFVRGGLLFAIIPVTLSLLGFLGVTLVQEQGLAVNDPQMVSPLVIAALLPEAALYFFILMAFAGLCSTMDSAFCSISALGSVDIYKRYSKKHVTDKQMLYTARKFMLLFAIVGVGISLLNPKLLWLFFIYGALASAGFIPTIMAVFSKDVGTWSTFAMIIVSVIVAVPFSIYANVSGNVHLNVAASMVGIITALIVLVIRQVYKKNYLAK